MNKILQEVLKVACEGYGEESRIDEELPLGERGDSLADFVRQEIAECVSGMTDRDASFQEAVRAMKQARNDISSVIEALEQASLSEQ